MFSLTVCDHVMVAHSLRGEAFGPARKLHGATFVVEAEFRAEALDQLQLLIDIGVARAELRLVLDAIDYSNLDDLADVAGRNTTTEYMACYIHGLLAAACRNGRLGDAGRSLAGMKIVMRESPLAWAAFEGPIG